MPATGPFMPPSRPWKRPSELFGRVPKSWTVLRTPLAGRAVERRFRDCEARGDTREPSGEIPRSKLSPERPDNVFEESERRSSVNRRVYSMASVAIALNSPWTTLAMAA